MSILPATKANDLIIMLNELAHQKPLDALALKRLERDAEKLIKVDPVGAYAVLGGAASLRGSHEDVNHFHRLALGLCRDAMQLKNYAVSLDYLGKSEDAYSIALEAHENDRGYREAIGLLIELAERLGKDEDYLKFHKAWRDLTGEEFEAPLFPEDNPQELGRLFDVFDKLIEECPQLVVKPDENFWNRIGKLVEGVEID